MIFIDVTFIYRGFHLPLFSFSQKRGNNKLIKYIYIKEIIIYFKSKLK